MGTIIRILNEKGYPSPGRLRYERGIITNNNKKGKGLLWNRHVLTDLLYNIAYIGHLAQGKSSSCLHKGIPFHWTDPSEWDIAENTHEPIIRMELWEQVQKVNQSLSKTAKSTQGKYSDLPKRENPYGDLLRCADCGRVIRCVPTAPPRNEAPKATTPTNVLDTLNWGKQAVRKELCVLQILIQLCWRPFTNRWRCFWTHSACFIS